ncbi:MAG: hypothetical protein H0V76_11215 [Blastocatellia bacterium]|nr:hypothetical protein [Blastocatellia bacterium]
MLGNNSFRKLITSFTALAVFCVSSMVALAGPQDGTAEITVSGQVTVNGQTAVSNSTIVSGSTIVTGPGSSASISLGRSGRVEVMENSNMILNFSAVGIVGILSSGKSRVSNSAGVPTTVTTSNATVIADAGQANSFVVEVECAHAHIDVTSGLVTVREGGSDQQVAAGSSAVAGNPAQTGCEPCLRPGSAPPVRFGGWWLWLLAAGVAGAAILIGTTRDNKTRPGGGTVVVSPVR